ncbi:MULTISPECIES: TetR/AcrR family transcriptional regulator [Reichenbachiella]|uniref:Transcriptional regulator, TetR family n=1 Tax=Reichenbachiella agariperforans TaxID=156994 RepID=A0A1M6WA15_REIAG|nr:MULTISPECIES: TetR/AcrR family transcriptional regulator [Reichenbachiella]RJE70342.1 hypothetical protein BGP76_09580 [Reichenbachiella sp. MSK19-1]SHK90356.1 transcriptional regulator, TetR family [Reichenbachiella agariperforans]
MINTKERILDTALDMFNELGMSQVSQRMITESMKISPGNLTYHFKKKDDIVVALYMRLVDRFSELFDQVGVGEASLQKMFLLSEVMYDVIYSYRFFFVDFVQLMRFEKIERHYRELLLIRKEQFSIAVEALCLEGVLRKEQLSQEYDMLFDRLRLVTDFFLLTLPHRVDDSLLKQDFLRQIKYTIYPYLSQRGRDEFQKWI